MGAFNTKTELQGNPALIPAIADRICRDFAADGYEVTREDLISGGVDISVTKGGMFKAVLGMRTALKVTLIPQSQSISFEAGVGIFGQQVVPTLIMLFITWPVLLTQIWGLVQQSKLDDRALAAARSVIAENQSSVAVAELMQPDTDGCHFCTSCGSRLPSGARFCSHCGAQVG